MIQELEAIRAEMPACGEVVEHGAWVVWYEGWPVEPSVNIDKLGATLSISQGVDGVCVLAVVPCIVKARALCRLFDKGMPDTDEALMRLSQTCTAKLAEWAALEWAADEMDREIVELQGVQS